MDASCKIQGSIHVFRLVNNMCPGKWVHIKHHWCYAFLLYYASIGLAYFFRYECGVSVVAILKILQK